MLEIMNGAHRSMMPTERRYSILRLKRKKAAAQIQERIQSLVSEARGQTMLFAYLRQNSRLYALAWKIGEWFKRHTFRGSAKSQDGERAAEGVFDAGVTRPPRSAMTRVISNDAFAKISVNFANDLAEIEAVAAAENKVVIAIGARGDELWPPYYSIHPPNWNVEEARSFDEALEQIEQSLHKGNLAHARSKLKAVMVKVPGHAYANFLMGKIYMKEGDWENAWNRLERAVDGDGFPHRGISQIGRNSRKFSIPAPRTLLYVDHIHAIRRLIADGVPPRLLMADWVHPNTLGHIVIGRHALCALSKFQAYSQLTKEAYCKALNGSSARRLLASLSEKMNVGAHDVSQAKQSIFRWAVLLARISAHPNSYYKIALENLKHAHPNFEQSAALKARVLTLKAFF